ncbi:hypothetical protein Pla123a_30990 [Posidoniimonas polymericola]|uniref:Uncharacterized protein n=1 Tax=Posidoniimonas polymericola TaxID=2528002 RepID=A0A5C5YLB3_9BACT|nr:hypothetical protein [Posidoniimonas polymericola]TWT75589.1 hypothetical protein Pla123a_30990 [Posidoniimonas polymericola]
MANPAPSPPPSVEPSTGEPADAICAAYATVGPWPARLNPETADAYFARLIDERRLEAAVRFAAVWMGPRRAVWWGALCVWNKLRDRAAEAGPDLECPETIAVDAAVKWVLQHDEPTRRGAQQAADAAGYTKPAGALAGAAFWSGGSVSLPDCPEVPPPAGVWAKLVANCVQMVAAAPAAAKREQSLYQSLRMAAETLTNPSPWTHAPPRDPQA